MLPQNYRKSQVVIDTTTRSLADRDWGSTMSEGRILFKVSPLPCSLRWAGRLPAHPIIPDIPDIGLHEGTKGSELRIRWPQIGCKRSFLKSAPTKPASGAMLNAGEPSRRRRKYFLPWSKASDIPCHVIYVLTKSFWGEALQILIWLRKFTPQDNVLNVVIRHS